jgi:hypothetical protein
MAAGGDEQVAGLMSRRTIRRARPRARQQSRSRAPAPDRSRTGVRRCDGPASSRRGTP